MFIHNFKYTLRILFKNKALIFWTFAFPIILGTFFSMAFSDIEKNETLDIIEIAVVDNEAFQNNIIFKEAFKALSDKENEERLFHTRYVKEEEAKELLEQGQIAGYLLLEDTPKVVVAESGIDGTILKQAAEEILQSGEIMKNTGGFGILEGGASIADISDSHLSYTMIEFYTLIAMTCLYGGILGMYAINQNLPDMGSKGKRVAVSPVAKGKLVFGSILASYVVQLIGMALLFAYTVFVLKVDYGDRLLLIILLAMAGCLAGLTLGVAVAAVFKADDNLKTGIIISVTMLGCFLSGMMGITMKYIIDKNVPLINKLNPASMITDGFYSLYYYDTLERFYFDIASLLIFAFIMTGISMLRLRRQKYDSI